MRNGEEAIAWLDAQNGGNWRRKCLMGVRMSFALPGGVPDAGTAWDIAKHKHRASKGSQCPRGKPVFWETPGVADHVALGTGDGWCLSNDIKRSGYYDHARIDDITRKWGCQLQGWTDDLNGFLLPGNKPTGPTVDVSLVVRAAKNSTKCPDGLRLKRAVAKEVGQGDMHLVTSELGKNFIKQYSLVQRKYLSAKGFRIDPADVNGIPGRGSLEWLGKRHGFSVTG